MRAKVSKVLLALLTAICVAFFAYAGPGVYAEGEEPEEIIAQAETEFSVTYSDDQKEAYIVGLSNKTKEYTQIIIPSKIMGLPVTKISAEAFSGKNTVTKVVIPDTVKTIEVNAFRSCSSMTEITIPVDVIAYDAFNGCGATKKITYTKGSTGIMPDFDESWDNEKRCWYNLACRSGNLETVVFSDGITHIGNNAFRDRSKLTSVTMPNNEVTIGERAFEGCTVLPSLDTSKVTSFGSRALFNCQSLADITINSKVKELPAQVFYNCYVFNNVVIPDTVESIGSEAFRNCSAIETITIPVDTKTYDSFNGCSYIKTINYTYGRTGVMLDKTEDWNQETEYRYSLPMRTGKLETVNFADGITHIGNNSLRERENLKTVNFPNNEFTVGYAAFYNDKAAVIDDVTNVTKFDQYAFQGCLGLKDLTFNSKVTEIPKNCFYNCIEIEKLTIPDTVESIGSEAFRSCSGIATVSIPVDTKTYDSFNGCLYIKTINYTYGKTGVMLDKTEDWNGETDYRYSIAMRTGELETVNFADGITHIGSNTLRERAKLTTVNFPNNEYSVGYAAFYQDTALTIDDISKVTEIGAYAFQAVLGLNNLVINDKVSAVPAYAFRNCIGIEKVFIPDSVTEIGNEAFSGCSSIAEMTLPVDVNYSDNSFSNYNFLTKVTYTKGTTGVSANSMNHNNDYYSLEKRCKNIETVIFDDGVINIHNRMFNADINKSVKNVRFANTVSAIGESSFVKGIDAIFYGYKDTYPETFAKSDDSITYRYLEYPYVTPDADVEAGLGDEVDFDAYVYTDIDTKSDEIEWSVKDNNSKKTTIKDGKLTVGSNEKSTEIKVCATYGENTVEVPVKINRSVFIVEFDAGEGTSAEEAMACNADGMLEVLPRARYDYFTFVGWFTAKDGGEKIDINTVFTEDTVVYAHYSLTPADSVEIKAGAQPKSGDTFDTTVGKVSDNIDAASVKVSYALDGKEVTGEAKCLKTYTINVSFKLKNGYTITDASKVSVNGGNVKATEAEGVYTVSSTFAATTHGETILKYAKEATKDEEGYSGDKCCSICNEVLEKGKTIAKLPADSTDPTNPTNPENPDDGYVDASTLKIGMIKSGLLVADKKSGAKYKITKVTKKKGKISGGNVTFMMQSNKNAKSVTVKDTVVLAGVKFKVTEINAKAFDGCAKLTKVTIGKNVTKIGANAFNGDAKLKNVIFKGTKVKKMGKNAYKGTYKKIKFKAPKKVVKKYKKLIKKAGAPKKFKITKK